MDEQFNGAENIRKIHESINRLLNTKTNLKRKKKSQANIQKQIFCDVITGIIELNNFHFRLGKEFGVYIESYYNISLSIIEYTLELFLGKDILALIIYFLESLSGEQPSDIIFDGDENPLVIKTVDELWDLIVKLKPEIANEK